MKVKLLYLLLGLALGGFLFVDTRPRSLFAFRNCGNCLHPNEITGMFVAAGIQRAPGLIPFVEMETEKVVVFRHPLANSSNHFIAFPKKDVKSIGDLEEADTPYLGELFGVIASLIEKHHMKNYRVWSNGPGLQSVGYLHFHLEER